MSSNLQYPRPDNIHPDVWEADVDDLIAHGWSDTLRQYIPPDWTSPRTAQQRAEVKEAWRKEQRRRFDAKRRGVDPDAPKTDKRRKYSTPQESLAARTASHRRWRQRTGRYPGLPGTPERRKEVSAIALAARRSKKERMMDEIRAKMTS